MSDDAADGAGDSAAGGASEPAAFDPVDYAARATATGPLCDACLGRPVADRSFGLRNEERGRALRTAAALAADEPYDPPEPGDCWVCEGVCDRFDDLADRVVAELEGVAFDSYQLGSRVPPLLAENGALLREELGLPEDAGEELRKELNREVGRRVGARTGAEVDFERPQVQVTLDIGVDPAATTVEVDINSLSIYGRYRKLERMVPQTEWPCSECGGSGRQHGVGPCPACDGTGYRYRTSVEQEVAPTLLEAHRGTEAVFHGAGREDVDALMVGTGRPFVVEVEAPHRRDVDLATLEREINESDAVEVVGLRYATHDMVERVKGLEASKTYRMVVAFDEPVAERDLQAALDELRGTTVEQRTPNRVDHRRADLVRERTVYDVSGSVTDDSHATLVVHGAGGLYVKELVSGDEGRTEPSLAGLLGVDCEVTALDVMAVEGEAEPFERDEFFRDGDAAGAGGRDPADWSEGVDGAAAAAVTERAGVEDAIAPVSAGELPDGASSGSADDPPEDPTEDD